jgi:DNA-binding NtrC family response regulator
LNRETGTFTRSRQNFLAIAEKLIYSQWAGESGEGIAMTEILCAWLGKTDVAESGKGKEGSGPIHCALKDRRFDRLLLLSSQDTDTTNQYLNWLGHVLPIPVHPFMVDLPDPTVYDKIYQAASNALKECRAARKESLNFTFHLSCGTPAMGAVWIILANSVEPAGMIQTTSETGFREVHFSFAVETDFLAKLTGHKQAELVRSLTRKPDSLEMFGGVEWQTPAMQDLLAKARHLADFETHPILILGETGSGKEELAKYIIKLSSKSRQKVVPVNCGALPPSLAEAELFGHVKGAYTGAIFDRPGYLEQADKATLFLDEIGEMPHDIQVKLLRALNDKQITRVGGVKPIKVDFRLISATNRDLTDEVAHGRFREDLFYRISGTPLKLPPLRERTLDILPLAELLLRQINEHHSIQPNYTAKTLADDARQVILEYRWPGNVRELHTTLNSAAIWGSKDAITAADLRSAICEIRKIEDVLNCPLGNGFALQEVLDTVERRYLVRALEQSGGNLSKAAELLGFATIPTFTNRAKAFGLHSPKPRSES